MTVQSVASVVRQILAVAVTVYGVLSASVAALHLPPAVSTALVAFGPVLLSIEHFVGDPSTGTPVTTPSTPAKEVAAPVAPVDQSGNPVK